MSTSIETKTFGHCLTNQIGLEIESMQYPLEFQVNKTWGVTGFPYFAQPQILGYYSINGNREFSSDLSQLKYYQEPRSNKVQLDLNHGYEVVRRMPPDATPEKLDHLLQWILTNSSAIRAPAHERRWILPHFTCSRGLLRILWCTPFNKLNDWIICACMWRGTVYLCAYETEKEKRTRANRTERELQFMSWGYKFEQYLVSESPGKRPNIQEPVNEREQFNCVFRSCLGANRLLYGAEMDGVSSKQKLKHPVNWNKQKFVELKTNRMIETNRQDEKFRKFKLLNWWCQNFLVGIENVLCGFRDDNGVVRELKTIDVADMPKLAQGRWNPAGCMNFGNEFLSFVKSVVRKDYEESVYKFEYHPRCAIQVQELDGNSEYSFLPRWFIERAERNEHK